jgi:hypothetical protein
MCFIPVVKANDSGVLPEESVKLKFTGTDFDSFESEIKYKHMYANSQQFFILNYRFMPHII